MSPNTKVRDVGVSELAAFDVFDNLDAFGPQKFKLTWEARNHLESTC